MPVMRPLILFVLLLSSTACVSPVTNDRQAPPELAVIRKGFEKVVEAANNDPEVEWVNGWAGNSAIKESEDGKMMGYCYEWQELVYERLADLVHQQQWELLKININRDWFSEHHSVVVYDPKVITQEKLLVDFGPSAYVLDAWQRGAPDIYTLEAWLSIPVIVFEPASFELEPGVFWRPGGFVITDEE